MEVLTLQRKTESEWFTGHWDILVTGKQFLPVLFSLTSRHKEVGINRSSSGKDKLQSWSP